MKDRRFMVAALSPSALGDILAGRVRVVNWPEGGTVEAAHFEFESDRVLLRIRAEAFDPVPRGARAQDFMLQAERVAAPEPSRVDAPNAIPEL